MSKPSVPNKPAQVKALAENPQPRSYNSLEEGLAEFSQMFCYICGMDSIVRLSDFSVFKPDPFKQRQYGNWLYAYEAEGDKKYRPIAPKWLQRMDRNQLDSMTYAPGKPSVVGGALNRWRGLASQPKQGYIGPWNELLDYLFPDAAARKYFEQWLAYPIQHPGAKLKTAVVLHSRVQGIGKSILTEAVAKIYGLNAQVIDETQLYDKFNSWQLDKQLIVGEEIQGGRDKKATIERLKLLVTSQVVSINQKFQPQFDIPNVANFIFLSNNPDPIYLSDQDRRFWVWEIPQVEKLSAGFYNDFRNWKESSEGIAALHWHLLDEVDTKDFNPDASAPMTESKKEMIELNRSELDRWVRDLINNSQTALYTMDDLLEKYRCEQQLKEVRPKEGTSAMHKALKRAGLTQAHGGKQVRIDGNVRALWVIAEAGSDESRRLISITEPAVLAEEYRRQRERRRTASLPWVAAVRAPEPVRATEDDLKEQKVN